MAKQTINVGTTPNDGTGDTLRTAGQKINSNFTEVYNTSQAGFDKANAAFNYANTIVSDIQTDPYARTTANAAFVQANTATTNANAANTTAQSAFDKANTATTNASAANTTAQSAFDRANTTNTLTQSGFDKANTANSLAQAAFDQANTAGGVSLPLANGTSNIDIALANGPITLTANVFLLTLDDTNGSIDLPGNVTNFEACSAINFVANSSGDGYGYSTIQLIPDTNATQDQYIIIDPTAPGHIHVRAGGQQDGSTADLFLGGEYSNFKVPAGSNTPVYITSNNISWQFDDAGLLKVPGAVNFQQNATIPLAAPAANGVNDRITLWDFQGGGSGYNYAIGVEGNHIWFTMDVNNGTGGFKFYSRDNEIFKIRDDGALLFADSSVQTSAGLTANSVATINNKSFDVSVGSNNIFSIQGQSITSYSGSGQVVLLQQSPTISVLNLSDSQLNLDGGSGTYYWGGQSGVTQAGDLKAGVYSSDPSSNNSLFTFGGAGANNMSVAVEGSLFVGTALPSNDGGLNTSFPGWLVVQSGGKFGGTINTLGALQFDNPATGKIIFSDYTEQATAANQGFRNTLLINTASHNAANNEEILLCDPNAAGSNVVINLSANVSDGKIFTIKNINPGGNSVNVASTTIEDPVSKSIVSEVVMANTGEVYTWVAYSGVYRHIG